MQNSVVQRQLWLMHNQPGLTRDQAYDEVRKEFYRLRHEEEVESRVAVEEARVVGAYFGKTRLEIGMALEDKEYERWKRWAAARSAKVEAERAQAYQSFGEAAEKAADEEALENPEIGAQLA